MSSVKKIIEIVRRIMIIIAIGIGCLVLIFSAIVLIELGSECNDHTIYRQYADFSEPIQEVIHYSTDQEEVPTAVDVYISGEIDGELTFKYDLDYPNRTLKNDTTWIRSKHISGAVSDTTSADFYDQALVFMIESDTNILVTGDLKVTFKFYSCY